MSLIHIVTRSIQYAYRADLLMKTKRLSDKCLGSIRYRSDTLKKSLLNYVPYVPSWLFALRAFVSYIPLRITCLDYYVS